MKICAEQGFSSDGYSVEIHIMETPPKHQETVYFDLKDVMRVQIDEDFPYKKGTLEYTASVFKQQLPQVYEMYENHNFQADVIYSIKHY